MFLIYIMCILESGKNFLNDDHLPLDVTFVIGVWWHHVKKSRWLMMVLPFLLEVFLVRLALQLEMFMDSLFPRLHPFFLILLSCHLSALRSCHFVGLSASLIVLRLQRISGQHIPEGIYNFETQVVCPEFCNFHLC